MQLEFHLLIRRGVTAGEVDVNDAGALVEGVVLQEDDITVGRRVDGHFSVLLGRVDIGID
jgi:hypothetical protein